MQRARGGRRTCATPWASRRQGRPGLCLSETPWDRSMPLSLSRTHTLARKYTDLHLIIRYLPALLLSSSLSASSSFPPSFLLLLPHLNTMHRSGHCLSSQTCKYEAWRDRLHLYYCSSTGGLPDLEGQWENPSERRQLDIFQASHRHGQRERHQRNPHGMCSTSPCLPKSVPPSE